MDDPDLEKALYEFYVSHKCKRSSDFPVANTFTRYSGKLPSTIIGGLSPSQRVYTVIYKVVYTVILALLTVVFLVDLQCHFSGFYSVFSIAILHCWKSACVDPLVYLKGQTEDKGLSICSLQVGKMHVWNR
ncbi:hypothetical protein TRIUR3_33388 [Triticum urartu]|uniref:Uncharacterized protein n=1 Tax=Triticum urartu TaxID=4572 RepID=M7ZC84_TRIUA|nr:hypothetical protein TRIUR3_33388 [Triticum urartu]